MQDLLGGDILKTQTTDGLHFYNFIDGTRLDLTSSQFDQSIGYDDLSSSRAEALADTTVSQYEALRSRVTPRQQRPYCSLSFISGEYSFPSTSFTTA